MKPGHDGLSGHASAALTANSLPDRKSVLLHLQMERHKAQVRGWDPDGKGGSDLYWLLRLRGLGAKLVKEIVKWLHKEAEPVPDLTRVRRKIQMLDVVPEVTEEFAEDLFLAAWHFAGKQFETLLPSLRPWPFWTYENKQVHLEISLHDESGAESKAVVVPLAEFLARIDEEGFGDEVEDEADRALIQDLLRGISDAEKRIRNRKEKHAS